MTETGKARPKELVRKTLAFARAHPACVAAGTWLVVLTVLAALPVDPEGPYDARTYERARGFRLGFPAAGAVVEPLAATGHAVAGAPDIVAAGISTLIWISTVAAAVVLFGSFRRRPALPSWVAALKATGAAGAAAGVFLAYVAFACAVHLPSWRLEHDDPDLIVAELQTHTFGSHDGLIGARDNLELHRDRGFDVVAVTEHDDVTGSVEARELAAFFADELPAVIAGVEIRSHAGAYLLALGLGPEHGPRPGRQVALGPLKGREDLLCEAVRTVHGGAVLGVSWQQDAEGIHRMAAAGVDGFEIANLGHPDVPPEVRQAMLSEASERGLVLVASSDWHGLGGFWRTWTAVRHEGASDLPQRGKAEAVLRALRERRTADVAPIVAGYIGPPSVGRAVFAPFVELLRYAAELSALRVVSWWVWTGLVFLAAEALRRRGLRPGATLLVPVLLVLAAGILWRGGALLWARASGVTPHEDPVLVGGLAVAIGVAALAAAVVLATREMLRLVSQREEG